MRDVDILRWDDFERSRGDSPVSQVPVQPHASPLFPVRYSLGDGRHVESQASRRDSGCLFIESTEPLPVGTRLAVEFASPEHHIGWQHSLGQVVWICRTADQFNFRRGMGVRLLTNPPKVGGPHGP